MIYQQISFRKRLGELDWFSAELEVLRLKVLKSIRVGAWADHKHSRFTLRQCLSDDVELWVAGVEVGQ